MVTRASENLNIVFIFSSLSRFTDELRKEKKMLKTLIASLAFVKVAVILLSYHLSLSQLTKQTFWRTSDGVSTFHFLGLNNVISYDRGLTVDLRDAS